MNHRDPETGVCKGGLLPGDPKAESDSRDKIIADLQQRLAAEKSAHERTKAELDRVRTIFAESRLEHYRVRESWRVQVEKAEAALKELQGRFERAKTITLTRPSQVGISFPGDYATPLLSYEELGIEPDQSITVKLVPVKGEGE